ncbi:hypothetical protein [Kribbella sp.]|uniref:hypothetical protein n=1 Tax=Kribbella sp. TaxID=1871183 RepID=UPI002D3B0583|nr:hypothetical protein [Kribbella sp.]HZX05096.1 hypothetical protein [Kribbella sp.]
MRARIAMVAAGILMALWGGWKLLQSVDVHGLVRLPLWLGGAVVADDFVLAPLTVAVGWVVAQWSHRPGAHRTVGVVRTTLLYVGITSLIAIPLLLRQGTGVNPTVLPRDYLRDWLVLEATIVVIGAVGYFTFSRRRASSGDIGGR